MVKSHLILSMVASFTLVCGVYSEDITSVIQCMNTNLTSDVLEKFPKDSTSTVQNCVLAFVKGSVNGDLRTFASPFSGNAGDIGMFLDFSLLSSNVSFAGLRVQEEPSSHGTHTGYFSDISWSDKWYHTSENGAGTWSAVDSKSNYYATDRAYIGYCGAPWNSGTLSWEIPNIWLPPIGSGGDYVPMPSTFKVIWQTVTITPDGTVSVSKHGHTVTRSTNGVIFINGVKWQ